MVAHASAAKARRDLGKSPFSSEIPMAMTNAKRVPCKYKSEKLIVVSLVQREKETSLTFRPE